MRKVRGGKEAVSDSPAARFSMTARSPPFRGGEGLLFSEKVDLVSRRKKIGSNMAKIAVKWEEGARPSSSAIAPRNDPYPSRRTRNSL